jgi:hypothetical protein
MSIIDFIHQKYLTKSQHKCTTNRNRLGSPNDPNRTDESMTTSPDLQARNTRLSFVSPLVLTLGNRDGRNEHAAERCSTDSTDSCFDSCPTCKQLLFVVQFQSTDQRYPRAHHRLSSATDSWIISVNMQAPVLSLLSHVD